MMGFFKSLFSISLMCRLLVASATAPEPAQYCRYGFADKQVDFCMGVTMLHNRSTGAHDMYMRLRVTGVSKTGWTSIGTGPVMDGSLMFIVYGDAESGQPPVLSVRTANGHEQPTVVSTPTSQGLDLRLMSAYWSSSDSSDTTTAEMAIVCYSCSRWSGRPIDAESASQPWIWAWNDRQQLTSFSVDEHLQMHKHHAGNGGWGVFYLDMASTISHDEENRRPSFPPLRSGVGMLGASDQPIGAEGILAELFSKPVAYAHGILMILAFVFLLPAGAVLLRLGTSGSFRNHWVLQLLGVLFAVTASVLGSVMSSWHDFLTAHRGLGTALVCSMPLQMYLGWAHHVKFVKIRRRTRFSHVHIWLGRLVMVAGWVNVVLGLRLSGHLRAAAAFGTLEVLMAFGAVIWLAVDGYRRRRGV